MDMVKHAVIAGFVGASLIGASPALATDSVVESIDKKTIKDFCDKTGGEPSEAPDGSTWGCKNECNGGDCVVTCTDKYCLIHTPERRVTETTFDPKADGFLVLAVGSGDDSRGDERGGWLGLLGLIGLAGLMGLKRASERPKAP